MGREVEDFSCGNIDVVKVLGALTDAEAQAAADDAGELLVLVGVGGDDEALAEGDLREHRLLADDAAAGDLVHGPVLGHVVPAVMHAGGGLAWGDGRRGHGWTPFTAGTWRGRCL